MNSWLNGQFYAKPLQADATIASLEAAYSNLSLVQTNLDALYRDGKINDDEAARRRDVVLNDLLRISDHTYELFKHSTFINNSAFNTGFDLTSIGLSSAATLVGGPAAQALSATDTGIKAAQGKISDRWLSSRTVPALVAMMDAMRAETLAIIYQKMGTSYAKFGLGEGIRLVAKYHQEASLLEAMNRLTAQADAQRTEKEGHAKSILTNKISQATSPNPATSPAH